MQPRPGSKRKPKTTPPDEEHRETTAPDLGRADDSGHPGGAPDLDAKSDTEAEHAHR
jgi:hypothetical protein